MADPHKMSPDEARRAGVEGSKRGVLHQRSSLPFRAPTIAITGFLICGAIGYFALYAKKKPEASALDVARVATNTADPDDTRPRKAVDDVPPKKFDESRVKKA